MISAMLVLAALAIVALVVRREFASPSIASRPRSEPAYLEHWQDLLSSGVVMGHARAPVKIIEFADLECPYCRTFDLELRRLHGRFGDSVAFVFLHYPLPNHRFAMPAARAMECAAEHGRAEHLMRSVYDKQDSLGLKSWASFGVDAGVSDSTWFAVCVGETATRKRINAGIEAGRRLGVRATPTVIVNGWRYPSPPDSAELFRRVESLLAESRRRGIGH
jgi:protein-disulfide isomerase